MGGAVERSGSLGQANGLAGGAGESVPLTGNGNFEQRPHLYIQAAFALCKFAKGKPWADRMNTMIAVKQLRLLARYDSPALREVAMRSLERLSR